MMSLEIMIKDMAKEAKMASRLLRRVGRAQKDAALKSMADKLIDRKAEIAKENERDLARISRLVTEKISSANKYSLADYKNKQKKIEKQNLKRKAFLKKRI